MSQCNIGLDSKARLNNKVNELLNSKRKELFKTIKDPDALTAAVEKFRKENNLPKPIHKTHKTFVLNRISNGTKETKIDVYDIEKTHYGFKVLYITEGDGTEGSGTSKVITIPYTGKLNKTQYNISQLNSYYNTLEKTREANIAKKEDPKTKEVEKIEPGQQTFTFDAEANENIEINDENTEVISAAMINDQEKMLDVLNNLFEIDGVKISKEYKDFLIESLKRTTDRSRKVIPDIIQNINYFAKENYGKVILEGQKKGIYVGVSKGLQIAGNQMSAGEKYVHEVKHASVEYALAHARQKIPDVIKDIENIYHKFLSEVKEEDFMPEKSINRSEERRIAKERIAYLKDPNKGFHEFIVMSETNMSVKKVLEDRVTAKRDDVEVKGLWNNLVKQLIKLHDFIYSYMRGNTNSMDGATAMMHYVQELNAANNIALSTIKKENIARRILQQTFSFLNGKGSEWIHKAIDKIKGQMDFEVSGDLKESLENFSTMTRMQKLNVLRKLISNWVTTQDVPHIGSFETILELLGLKPEGTMQQLIRRFRDSDVLETDVEKIGLLTKNIENNTEDSMIEYSSLVNNLIKEMDISESENFSIAKIGLELELDGLSDGMSTKEISEILSDDIKLKSKIAEITKMIELSSKDRSSTNFMISQARALGKYMVTGQGVSGLLLNANLIQGLASGTSIHIEALKRSNGSKIGEHQIDMINKLSTLYGIQNSDKQNRDNVSNVILKDRNNFDNIMKYSKMAREELGKSSDKNGESELHYVKGRNEKVKANYINSQFDKVSNRKEMESHGYRLIEETINAHGYGLYVSGNHTQAGWRSEGIVTTNDGRRINSLINMEKLEWITAEDMYTKEGDEEVKHQTEKLLILENEKLTAEFNKMRENKDYEGQDTGDVPIYRIGKKGMLSLSDLDMTVKTDILDREHHARTDTATMIGRTYSRAVNLMEAKKNNNMMIDVMIKDMYKNYSILSSENAGGSKNLMSYVKIGPTESNPLNKEIWPTIPRYLKLRIIREGHDAKIKEIADMVTDFPNLSITNDKIKEIDKELLNESLSSYREIELIKQRSKAIQNEINNIAKELEDSNHDLSKEIRGKMKKIATLNPHIGVRRNMVYHYFGNREYTIADSQILKDFPWMSNFASKAGMIFKHIAKVYKVSLVVKDGPVLMFNLFSNFIRAVIDGDDPFREIEQQFKGIKYLNKLRRESKEYRKLMIKSKAGTMTKADKDRANELKGYIEKNPAKRLTDLGLYSSTAEELGDDDLHNESYVDHMISKHTEWIPDGIKSVFDILYITQKTEGFKSLLLFMQVSDFGARYSTFYSLLEKGYSEAEAAKIVLDNQINYNFSHGKLMQWLNATTLGLFTLFWEGIQRVLRNITLEKPFNVLMAMGTGVLGPLGDSMFSRTPLDLMHNPITGIYNEITSPPPLVKLALFE